MSATGERHRRWLTFNEVRTAGLPATYSGFGDHLAFVEGNIYAFPRKPERMELDEPYRVPGVYVISNTVGVEHGWEHLESCDCHLCRHGELEAA